MEADLAIQNFDESFFNAVLMEEYNGTASSQEQNNVKESSASDASNGDPTSCSTIDVSITEQSPNGSSVDLSQVNGLMSMDQGVELGSSCEMRDISAPSPISSSNGTGPNSPYSPYSPYGTLSSSPYSSNGDITSGFQMNTVFLTDGTPLMFQDNESLTSTGEQDNVLMDLMSTLGMTEDQKINDMICPICGQEAGRHSHYGGRGCSSCRAFFRRSVQSKSYQKFKCSTGTNNCKIDSKSWKSCRYCRYQKCLASGMKPAWVLNEAERRVRHEKRTAGRSPNKSKALVPVMALPVAPNEETFNQDERQFFVRDHERWKKHITVRMTKFYASNIDVFRIMMSALYYRTNIPFECLKQLESGFRPIAHEFFATIPDMRDVCQIDKQALVETNTMLMMSTMQAVAYGNRHTSQSLAMFMSRLFNSMHEDSLVPLHSVLQELNVSGRMPESNIRYEQIFQSPWAPHISLEERHLELTQKISRWPVDPDETHENQVKVDPMMIYFLAHIMLFNTDFVQLVDAAKVNKIQDKYLRMLHRYLKFKYPDEATKRLGNGIMIAALARESYEIKEKRLPV